MSSNYRFSVEGAKVYGLLSNVIKIGKDFWVFILHLVIVLFVVSFLVFFCGFIFLLFLLLELSADALIVKLWLSLQHDLLCDKYC